MDVFPLRVFQSQLRDQCAFLLMSARCIDDAIRARDSDKAFYYIQNLLAAGANISKLLWGQGGKHAEKRKRLRESIGVKDDSPLREVAMRNHFEHIDDRIDRWWQNSKRHNHIDRVLGPPNAITGFDAIDTFRWYDPRSGDVIFWGDRFNLRELVEEVHRIQPAVEKESQKSHWEA